MALRARFYIFEEGGALKHVPRRVCEGLYAGEDALPEYADTTQRVVQVLVENEDGKPARILDAMGHFWKFDAEGKFHEDQKLAAWEAMEFAFQAPRNPAAKVVDLRPELKKKEWQERHRWHLTAEDLNRIAASIWPGLAEVEEIKSVKGKAPKRPPLTQEAKSLVREIHSKLADIGNDLQDLSEPGLRGLIFEANRISKAYSEHSGIWSAIAQEADKHLQIKARQRTGKGVFYAVLHVWHEYEKHFLRELDTIEEKCQGKTAALEAARRLLAGNAHRYGESTSIEVEVLSDLEWTPRSDGERD